MIFRQLLLGALIISVSLISTSTNYTPVVKPINQEPAFLLDGNKWVDSVMQTLTPEQRIGQLFMVAAYSNKPKTHQDEIIKLIKNQQIGGLIFMQGGPVRQAKLCNMYQQISNVPLMISIDGEWGLAMRLDSTVSFPKQMTLGAIKNDTLIYKMGVEIAKHCRRMGIHVNFAPDIDINNNASNPVINMRSFGENKYKVAAKGIAYMKGMQDAKVMATGKHFPGHGDTDSDSHKTLPTITHSRERLDSLELYPFKELINNGLAGAMVAHLNVTALDDSKKPSTLSSKIITDLLKTEMGFKGLIFTDALNMKGVANFASTGMVDAKALIAGNDVLLFSENVAAGIIEIKKAISNNEITQEEIDKRVKKILHAKYWLGLNKKQKIEIKNIYSELNDSSAALLNRQLTEASLTVLENKNQLIPLKNLDKLKIASIAIDGRTNNIFQKTLNKYTKIANFSVDKDELAIKQAALLTQLKGYNLVIVSVHNPKNTMSKSAGVTTAVSNFMEALNTQSKTILNVFANPYSLSKLSLNATPDGLIESYEDNHYSQELSAQLIFGAIKANGTLPVTVNDRYKASTGLEIVEIIRLKFTIPEELGIKSAALNKVDSIAKYAIDLKATPGCQIVIAKNGKVFYNKAFGNKTYGGNPVNTDDLYDIASITKIAASTVAIMKLTDEGFFDLNKTVGDYLPLMNQTNKGKIKLIDLLTHQAGLPAWIPFYTKTIKPESNRNKYYRSTFSDSFNLKVADNMFMRKDYPDSILAQIARCELSGKNEYKYSDLGYYFFRYIIEKHTQTPFDKYVDSIFYKPMGLSHMTFNPLNKFNKEEIVPTENDNLFRKQLVQGYVHDQGAAMMGGVAGHAGIFTNATDLAALMQMLLNKGEYGGNRFISSKTITEFTKCLFCEKDNRRGIGFDKPEMDYKKTGPTCKCVSALSFGHTGFTGTIAWVDPQNELVYVFLSNRVNPDAENKRLNNLATRVEIQEAIYNLL
jgi:beta-glucosidase-like glycosyl hydrolase/CubicO group peptidase (beta-lactamase class C family)